MPTSEATDAQESGAEDKPDLGARLRHARETQGLGIDELATELRISAAALSALEDCRFEALGAPVFAKGYLKQYGARLGLDVRELIRAYELAAGESQFEMAPLRKIRLRDDRQIRSWLLAGLAFSLVIGFLAYWWLGRGNGLPDFPWIGTGSDSSTVAVPSVTPDVPARPAAGSAQPTASRASPAAEAGARARASAAAAAEADAAAIAPAAAEPPASPDLPAAAGGNAGGDGVSTSPIGSTAAGIPPPGPASDSAAVSGPTAAAVASTAAANATVTATGDAAASPVPATPGSGDFAGPALEVLFVEDSWAEIIDQDGNRLFYNLGRAGTRARFPADRNLNLLFGNARGVELSLDGEALVIPGARRAGQVVEFDLAALIE